jgi:hypothetical protein
MNNRPETPVFSFPRRKSIATALGLFLSIASFAAAEKPLPKKISFNRDIRPIMSDTCFHCHGFDPNTREEDLRLDIREEALKPSKNDTIPIIPGDPEGSEIIYRIFDEGDPMPPEKAHKPLTDRQKALFRQWVAEGAEYEAHWAYTPLKKPAAPSSNNLIDGFIRAKLTENSIQPSPEAPKARLLRRLSLDLTGLPPTPDEVSAFLNSDSPKSYNKEVKRLLDSPHFGERMAVWWLDVARYADTVGFHGDQNQRIFPYRDYVINSFNQNKSFDQFTIEQLAGDLLPNPKTEQLNATGYNRLNMMTREGGAQPAEYLAKYGAERVRSVAAAWFGSTFGCAECHDHKFDPIKTRDFYELQSFFADMRQWGVYANYGYTPEPELKGVNNDSPFPPEIEVETPWYKKRLEQAQGHLDRHLSANREKVKTEILSNWKKETQKYLDAFPDGWMSAAPTTAKILKKGKPIDKRTATISKEGSVKPDKGLGRDEAMEVIFDPKDLSNLASVRINLLTKGSEEKALGKSLKLAVSIVSVDGKKRRIGTGLADAKVKRRHFRSGYEIYGIGGEWKLPYYEFDSPPVGTWLLDVPAKLKKDEKIALSFSGNFPLAMKVAFSPLGSLDPLDVASEEAISMVVVPPGTDGLEDTWLLSTAGNRSAFDEARKLAAEVRKWNKGRAWTLVTEARSEPRTVRVLPRGNFLDITGPVVLPATPSFLPARLESTDTKRLTRLDLANWIISEENPITARAVMNRLWQIFFGNGLSGVVDDLGSQGEPPSHPELLDWLASEFRESGWDMKHMINLIVTSDTYRQNSSLRSDLKDIDPANRLLASQNPRRLDAEFVRDNALYIAGLLNLEDIGGPSSKPYQPADYYAALQFPNRNYVADTGKEQWRRGLYTHWQRTFLHPMMASFDAPPRDECAALRTISNTPQQALTLLNDPTFVEAARILAGRLLKGAPDDEARLNLAYRLTLSRDPKIKEIASLRSFLEKQRAIYKANPDDAAKLLKIGLTPQPEGDAIETAAWTNVCRVILNSHETITRY